MKMSSIHPLTLEKTHKKKRMTACMEARITGWAPIEIETVSREVAM
jgi:hypothetical protein